VGGGGGVAGGGGAAPPNAGGGMFGSCAECLSADFTLTDFTTCVTMAKYFVKQSNKVANHD